MKNNENREPNPGLDMLDALLENATTPDTKAITGATHAICISLDRIAAAVETQVTLLQDQHEAITNLASRLMPLHDLTAQLRQALYRRHSNGPVA